VLCLTVCVAALKLLRLAANNDQLPNHHHSDTATACIRMHSKQGRIRLAMQQRKAKILLQGRALEDAASSAVSKNAAMAFW